MTQPRKERRFFYNAPQHVRRKMVAAHLAEDLMLRYKRRSIQVIKGDTVKIMRGGYRGRVGKVRKVDVKKQRIEVEGITITKVDGKSVPYPVHASNVMITKLNLTDPWRRRKLEEKLSEEEKKVVEKEAEEQIKEMEEEAMKAEAAEEEEEKEEEVIEEKAEEEIEESKEEMGKEEETEAKEEHIEKKVEKKEMQKNAKE
ncbi:MAG: 50S ribosomal protein L24 [Thermoplasmata archaeon]|nr:50S ribosomal protein L24 [Thermoplasmata archaeon]